MPLGRTLFSMRFSVGRTTLCGVALVIVACPTLTACTKGTASSETNTVIASVTAKVSTKPTATNSGSSLRFPPPLADVDAVSEEGFVTPSGNIQCASDPNEDGPFIDCVIAKSGFAKPVTPDGCQLDWMENEIQFRVPHVNLGVCRGDVPLALALRDKPVLKYGAAAEVGQLTCLSELRGVSCWDARSHHGFFLSREYFVAY